MPGAPGIPTSGLIKLFDDQHAGGLASKLELSRAKLALRTVSANIPEIERQIALKENEINTLLGRNPGPVARTSTLLAQEMPVEIPVGLPSTLLERRPDIRDGGAAGPRRQRGNRGGRRRLLPAHRPDGLLRRRQLRTAQPGIIGRKHLVGWRPAPPARCSPAAD